MGSLGRFIQDLGALLRSLLGPIASSLRGNASLAVLSLILAFALWVFITDTENPIRSGVLPVDIPVEAVNLPADVAVAGVIAPVRVRIEVAEDVWDTLTAADFRALVDLFGRQEGTHQAAVTVEALSGRGGLRIIQVIPDKVELVLKPLFSRAVPVVVEISGNPASGYELGEPQPESETVTVSGPEELVGLVREAVARVDVTGLTRDLQQAFRLRATDGRGQGVEGVVVEPAVINIRLPIRQKEFSRVLPVSPVLEGSPAEGYNVAGVSVDPPVVTVIGPLEAVSTLSLVRTKALDIGGAVSDVVTTVSLVLLPGISVAGSRDVQVTVRITPALGQAIFQVAPAIQNLGPDLRIANSLPPLTVTLSGELPTLRSLRPLDIIAVLDLDGLGAGTHTLQPKLQLPPGLLVVSVSPSEVQVVLEPRS